MTPKPCIVSWPEAEGHSPERPHGLPLGPQEGGEALRTHPTPRGLGSVVSATDVW